jgi:hypothetical protein
MRGTIQMFRAVGRADHGVAQPHRADVVASQGAPGDGPTFTPPRMAQMQAERITDRRASRFEITGYVQPSQTPRLSPSSASWLYVHRKHLDINIFHQLRRQAPRSFRADGDTTPTTAGFMTRDHMWQTQLAAHRRYCVGPDYAHNLR